jgi:hypothetical protein
VTQIQVPECESFSIKENSLFVRYYLGNGFFTTEVCLNSILCKKFGFQYIYKLLERLKKYFNNILVVGANCVE